MAEYAGYLKISAVGAAGGQQIVNTFYYANEGGETILISDAVLALMAAAWVAQFSEDYLGEMVADYTLSQVEASVVDLHGNTVSENTIELGVNQPGDIASSIPGPGLCAILSIKTSSIPTEGTRSLKRSYLAWGPVPAAFIMTTGELTLVAKSAYANIAALVQVPLTVGGVDFPPVRVADTEDTATPGVGTILSCTVQPFHQPRKSRYASPSGT